jgi:SAM-dependent methyltransferase
MAHLPIDKAEYWDQRYLQDDAPWDAGYAWRELAETVAPLGLSPGKALDVGCGSGCEAVALAKLGFDVVGLDCAPEAIRRAQKRIENTPLACTFVRGDFLAGMDLAGPFDFAYDGGCFHLCDTDEHRDLFARRVARQLRPGGMWLSRLGSCDGPPRPEGQGPPRRSARDIIQAVEPYFEIQSIQAQPFAPQNQPPIPAWQVLLQRRETLPVETASP